MRSVRGADGARRNRRDQSGFTLLETLIAMSILAVGLLGLAAMHTIALSFNVDAKELGRATNLAAAMVERIHYNRRNATAYDGIDTLMAPIAACPNAPAGGAQPTARGDCLQWQTGLGNANLDNAQGTVTVVNPFGPAALNQSQMTVNVSWRTKRGDSKVSRVANVVLQTVVTPP